MKYDLPDSQDEVLPNLLGLKTSNEIGLSEFDGFLKAEIIFTERLSYKTTFSVSYIQDLHRSALGHLYSFAGKFRDVNMSRGGFPFAAAKFLSETMARFEKDILSKIPDKYTKRENLINDIATVHSEFLFIHPFREGNGRTARILANLMARKQGYHSLKFELIDFNLYIAAVQKATEKDYSKMINLIESIFQD